jgi:hypothetical protein
MLVWYYEDGGVRIWYYGPEAWNRVIVLAENSDFTSHKRG